MKGETEMIKRFLYVEDGSVDIDLLELELAEDTKIIPYRQGATHPILTELTEPAKRANESWYESNLRLLITYIEIQRDDERSQNEYTMRGRRVVCETIISKINEMLGESK